MKLPPARLHCRRHRLALGVDRRRACSVRRRNRRASSASRAACATACAAGLGSVRADEQRADRGSTGTEALRTAQSGFAKCWSIAAVRSAVVATMSVTSEAACNLIASRLTADHGRGRAA